jgi:hypothetical protein
MPAVVDHASPHTRVTATRTRLMPRRLASRHLVVVRATCRWIRELL